MQPDERQKMLEFVTATLKVKLPPGVLRCKSCEHWEPIKRCDDAGVCTNRKLSPDSPPVDDELGHRLSGLTMSICQPHTGPDFGCVHWEAKGAVDGNG